MLRGDRNRRSWRIAILTAMTAFMVGLPVYLVIVISKPIPLTVEEQPFVGEWKGQRPHDDEAVLRLMFHPSRGGLLQNGTELSRARWLVRGKSLHLEFEGVSGAWGLSNRLRAFLTNSPLKTDKLTLDVEIASDDHLRLTKDGQPVMELTRNITIQDRE